MKDVTAKPFNPTGLVILVLWLGLGAGLLLVAEPPRFLIFVFVMVGWLLSVMAHEFGHALVGFLGGDHTVKAKGYLDFDPRRYADPFSAWASRSWPWRSAASAFPAARSICGSDLMRSRLWRTAASLAGPAGLTALIFARPGGWAWSCGARRASSIPRSASWPSCRPWPLILNLLPIPGLDGFNAIRPFLPAVWRRHPQARRPRMVLLLVLVFVDPRRQRRAVPRRRHAQRRRSASIPTPSTTAGRPSTSGSDAQRKRARRSARPSSSGSKPPYLQLPAKRWMRLQASSSTALEVA